MTIAEKTAGAARLDRTAAGGSSAAHRAAVSTAFLANGMFTGSWAPLIPSFAERLELSASRMGLMILAFGIGAVAVMPVAGRIIGSHGSRLPMLALNVALVFALPFLVLAPNVPLAVVAVLFAGAATGGMDVAMNANAVAVERRRRSAIMSSCHGFWSVGGVIGSALGGFVIAHAGPVTHGLLAGTVIFLGFLVVARWALSDAPSGETAAEAVAGVPHGTAPGAETAAAGLISGYRGAVLIGLFALFAMIPEGAAIDWSALYLKQELQASATVSGLAFAGFSFTMAAFRFAGDMVRDRLGAVSTMRWCSGAAGIGLLVAGLAPNPPVAILGFALMGIGISNMVPIAFSAAGNVGGLKPGAGLSTVTALGYSGILIAPAAIGFLGEHLGFAVVFLGLSAFLVVTLAAAPLMAIADGARRPR
ncbi:MFS transporter [Aureimonas leprariae]|uniref:MFS transporter n=1 Tax=Plantimonas leprariae TaxID=2615207 RepID=A0A7V7PNG9_9HYPH|nr:MFS transporter [Aureimonas leprariae]KAB0679256.1 MFS transporter [Aureimonas leprariae]